MKTDLRKLLNIDLYEAKHYERTKQNLRKTVFKI